MSREREIRMRMRMWMRMRMMIQTYPHSMVEVNACLEQ